MFDLLADQLRIIGDGAKVIFDVGTQTGETTLQYLEHFPCAVVHGIEAEESNWQTSREAVRKHGHRCSIHNFALASKDGQATFHVNSHSGTHSLLPIGAVEYWAAPEREVCCRSIRTRSLDSFAGELHLERIDILKMDIQGGELAALEGATNFLQDKRIGLIACEVSFKPLYGQQPLFWELCGFLDQFGYSFFQLYEPFYHPKNRNSLCWADAIFLSPDFVTLIP